MLRSTLSVLAGFVLWSVLWLGGFQALGALMPEAFPQSPDSPITSVPLLVTALGLSIICSLSAGLLTGWLTRGRSGRPLQVLAGALLFVGAAVQGASWSTMPLWYHLPFLILLVPACLLGGRLVRGRAG